MYLYELPDKEMSYEEWAEGFENFEIVVGTADEIRKTYDLMEDRCNDIDIYPLYADKPILVDGREYGISVDFNEKRFCVISADVAEEIIQEYGMTAVQYKGVE